ncbi:MAG: pyridoxamine 5'-phosphate oxidase family protein [Candidatus Competibacteraceae bacterium]|jgi:general stress protein 26|nr:pyridoxamine 5'-phosphate oxidase family protein [Candidatus Competibacteraceae bacterium]
MMTVDNTAKFNDLLNNFDIAMVVTTSLSGELRSHPMVIVEHKDDGGVLFVTREDSAIIMEVLHKPQVNVTIQSTNKFLSLSGTATISHDRECIKENWKPTWKAWFPDGQDDPTILLIRVAVHQGEYWDNAGFNTVQFYVEAGQAMLTGEPVPNENEFLHGKDILMH